MDLGTAETTTRTSWPKTPPEQFAVPRTALQEVGEARTEQLARHLQRLRQTTVQPFLETLTLLGHLRFVEGGGFAA